MTLRSRSVALFLLVTAFAFSLPGSDAAGAQDPPFDPASQGLDPTPLVNDVLGLKMYHPAGAEVTATQVGSGVTIDLRDGSEFPAWTMKIQTAARPARADPATPAGFAAWLADSLTRAGNNAAVVRNEPVDLGGNAGHMLVVEDNESVGIFLIATSGGDRYIVFRVGTFASDFQRVMPVIERSFQTVRLTSTEDLKRVREAQIARGREVVGLLTETRLRELVMEGDRWYRVYQPKGGDVMQDREVGYVRMNVNEAKRGALNPRRDEASYNAGEQEKGLMLALDIRYLENAERGLVADLQARYWQSWDRTDESWQITVTRRQGEASMTESETGIRVEELGYSKLHVVYATSERSREEWSWMVEEPYLSQAEVYLLGELLPRDGSITGEMIFRYYEPSLKSSVELPARLDEWKPASDGSGRWVLTSRPVPDMPPLVSTFDRNGMLIRREKGDGTVTEPIEPRQLLDIWKRKGLPTGG